MDADVNIQARWLGVAGSEDPQWSPQIRPMVVTPDPANGTPAFRRRRHLPYIVVGATGSGPSLRLCIGRNCLQENESRPSASEPKGSLESFSCKQYLRRSSGEGKAHLHWPDFR